MPVINPAEAEAVKQLMGQAEASSPVVQDPTEAANSSVPNENQDHPFNYKENPHHIQAKPAGQGERSPRHIEESKAVNHGGRHVVSKKDGRQEAKERAASVMANRKASEKVFADVRKPHSSAK